MLPITLSELVMTAFVLPARQLFLMVVDCPAAISTNVSDPAGFEILTRSRGDVVGHFGPVLRIELRFLRYKGKVIAIIRYRPASGFYQVPDPPKTMRTYIYALPR